MLFSKELIVCMVTTFFANLTHADHKRIIIRVPQRTKHIYHHHVKKVPVYILLPDKKPAVLEDLEGITKTSSSIPCKESHETLSWREDKPSSYRYARSERERELDRERDREKTHQPTRSEEHAKIHSLGWTEDRENKGAYVPANSYRTIEDDFPPPPPINLADLPFQRVYTEDSPSYVELQRDHRNRQPPVTYTEQSPGHSMVSFTYAPNTMQDSYQYRINRRMDNMTMER